MKQIILLVLIPIACVAVSAGTISAGAAGPAEGDFTGAWEFVRLDTPNGPSTGQRGHMVVFNDYVCHVRVQKDRQGIAPADSDAQKMEKAANIFNSSNAACGKFAIEGETLTVDWVTAVNPQTEGHSTKFILKHEGDLVTMAPAASPQFIFVYQRIK